MTADTAAISRPVRDEPEALRPADSPLAIEGVLSWTLADAKKLHSPAAGNDSNDGPNTGGGGEAGRGSDEIIIDNPELAARECAPLEHAGPFKAETAAETALENAAKKYIPEKAQAEFLQNASDLKDRAARGEIGEDEVRKTFESTTRLLEGENAKLDLDRRVLAAQGIMLHAAHPDTISQGNFTCTVHSLEVELFQRQPSIAANFIATVGLTGAWRGADGKTIEIDPASITPHQEERTYPPERGRRSFASQLFEVGTINDIGQHLDPPMKFIEHRDGPEGKPHPYWVLPDGKRIDFTQPGDGVFISTTGGITAAQVASEAERLAGQKYSVLRTKYDDDKPLPGMTEADLPTIDSPEHLEKVVAELKAGTNGERLPRIAIIHRGLLRERLTGVPAKDPSRAQIGDVPDHMLTITDYVPARDGQPAKIRIYDQGDCRTGGWLTPQQLFEAMT